MNRSALPRPEWKWSLATRLAVVWAVFIAMVVGISSWLAHRDGRQHLLDSLRQGIEQDAGEISVRLETWMQALQEDARSWSQSPLLYEFLSRRNTAQEALWRRLLEQEFRAVFAGKPAYFQMRLLAVGGEEDGREIVRLDRREGRLEVTPRERLQSKGDRTYYQEARLMPPDRIYLSEINLNRDFGGITEPHIPTIRAAAKVRAKGQGEAMLIINADLRPLFAEVRQLTSPPTEVRIVGARGDYVLHPKEGAAFASDLGRGLRFQEEYPRETPADAQQWLREGSQDQLALTKPVHLNGWPNRVLHLVVALPGHAWLPALESSRRRAMATTTLAVMAGAGVAFLLSLPLINRLRRLSTAIRQFNASGMTDTLHDSGKDEIGFAIERFREMAEKVRFQIEKLSAARDEAEQANAAKEEFLAIMSHEIRTPMNAVVGLIRALEANHPPAHQLPILRSLRSSASNLMALLNTALDYTRLKEGAVSFSEEDFDAARLLEDVAQSFGPAAMAKQLAIETDVPESLRLRGDPVRLRQIVNNLVSNAVKFTGSGFVRITLRRSGAFVECAVRDSGPGIDEADQERVFLPFVQAKDGRRSSEPGAGLGLSVSRALIEQQGGELILNSRPGEGTTMTLRFPYVEAAGGEPDVHEAMADLAGAPFRDLRLLYVEDVPSNRQVMDITLAGTGANLVCVGSGTEASNLLEKESFDLVLVDLQLPDMSGEDLARRLLEARPALPIVAVTAQASAKASQACREAGIRAVVLKPYSAESLFGVIAAQTGRVARVRPLPDTSILENLHPRDPSRARELAKSIADEMRNAARELKASPAADASERRRRLRRIRHQLTTAIASLDLRDLRKVFDDFLARKETPAALEPVVTALERAADDLEMWSAAACEVTIDS